MANTEYTYTIKAIDTSQNISQESTPFIVITEQPSIYSEQWIYDDLGRLINVIFENGDVENITYDPNGNISKIDIVPK
jgi:YD repeat-containing protein